MYIMEIAFSSLNNGIIYNHIKYLGRGNIENQWNEFLNMAAEYLKKGYEVAMVTVFKRELDSPTLQNVKVTRYPDLKTIRAIFEEFKFKHDAETARAFFAECGVENESDDFLFSLMKSFIKSY